jgi:phage gpG-like protein
VPVKRTGDWQLARELLRGAPARLKAATDRALRQEAEQLRSEVVEGITKQAPAGQAFSPLARFTVAKRRLRKFSGSKALIQNADLRNAITATVKNGEAFVGVPRKARGRDGSQLADVAKLNEFGSDPIIIPVTPKMRRFLHVLRREAGDAPPAAGGTSTPGVIVTRIPARPFLRPVFDKFRRDAGKRFLSRVAAQWKVLG